MPCSLLNTVNLSNNVILKYKELTFKQYRTLVKCLLGNELYTDFVFLNLNNILQDCIVEKNIKNLLKEIHYIDYIILVLLIRSVSIGNEVSLSFKLPNNQNTTTTVAIDLIKITDLLQQLDYNELLSSSTFDASNITVNYQLPTFSNIILYSKHSKESIYNFFIKDIIINKNKILFSSLSFEEQNSTLQQLPIKIYASIIKKIQTILEFFNNINFFESVYNPKYFNMRLPLLPDAECIGFLVKLLFNADINTLYSNIFMLINTSHFTGEYLDDCTPGEFYVFCKKLDFYLKEQNRNQSNSTGSNNYPDLPPLAEKENFELE